MSAEQSDRRQCEPAVCLSLSLSAFAYRVFFFNSPHTSDTLSTFTRERLHTHTHAITAVSRAKVQKAARNNLTWCRTYFKYYPRCSALVCVCLCMCRLWCSSRRHGGHGHPQQKRSHTSTHTYNHARSTLMYGPTPCDFDLIVLFANLHFPSQPPRNVNTHSQKTLHTLRSRPR